MGQRYWVVRDESLREKTGVVLFIVSCPSAVVVSIHIYLYPLWGDLLFCDEDNGGMLSYVTSSSFGIVLMPVTEWVPHEQKI